MYCIARVELNSGEQPEGSTEWFVGKDKAATGLTMTQWDHEPESAKTFASKEDAIAALSGLVELGALVGIVQVEE